MAGGGVCAFIIALMNFSADTMAEASLLDYNFVLLEEGIAGLAATGGAMGASPVGIGLHYGRWHGLPVQFMSGDAVV